MKTETIIQSVKAKSATVTLLRSLDLAALASKFEMEGQIPVEEISSAGEFEVSIQPKARGASETRVGVASEEEGRGYLAGFACAAEGAFKPERKPRKKSAEPRPANKPKQNGKTGTAK